MRSFVACDDRALGASIREILLRNALDCPAEHVAPLERAVDRCVRLRPDLLVVALGHESERALAVLAELKGVLQAHLAIVGPADNAKQVLRTLREGANEYLDIADLGAELTEAIARLRTVKSIERNTGRVIGVLGASGGSGSSTLAVNVAAGLAHMHQSAGLVDLKLHSGDLSALLDVKPTHTLADLCCNLARMDRSMFEQVLVAHRSGVHLLAAPRSFAEIEKVTTQGVRQAIILAKALFPFVVIDIDHSFRAEQSEALAQADVVLLVMRLDFTSLRNARRAMEHLEQMGIGGDRVRVVANRYRQPKELPLKQAESVLGVKRTHCIPDDPKSVNRANNKGIPVVLERPRAAVSRSLLDLAVSVNGVDGENHYARNGQG